jgi:beta-mannanase
VHAKGAVPYVTFDPKKFSNPDVQSQYAYLGQIPQGVFDAKLREVAGVLRDFGHPVVFRFAHEMNGNWYPYSGVFSGSGADGDGNGVSDGPQKYIAAWRYVHALFAAEGATKLAWVFSPNATSHPDRGWNAPFAYYPGSDYVDWIAVDVYEHPDQRRQGLASLLDPFMNEMGLFFEKHVGPQGIQDSAYALRPFGIAEFGTARTSGKADWYVDALATIAADTRISMHALYNAKNGSLDFSVGGLGPQLQPAYANPRLMFGPLPTLPPQIENAATMAAR